ncbi:altered inheritance of mitochondria protein 21 [Podospora australis]|uniref:Altered inheritance of mitochondria protein 21 n=1 Tax=Podospora australis TaxID=1536484 RepID=A0AAN7ALS7_9PEZI|nr:altered inheritance of mitochondria protein 21 [Podospora australis]
MSAQTAQQPPVIPPRPSRSQEKTSIPMVPPRPARRFQRSISPNPDRFAPSPLNESPLHKSSSSSLHPGGRNGHIGDHIPRSTSVDLPSLGEEGQEYAGLAQELSSSREEEASSPEHTRTVGEDLKLHAPKPSLPAASAKQRVMAVTRTDSDRAASFGIGRPSSNDDSTHVLPSNRSLKKKASTTSQLSTTKSDVEDEHGIPEIGLQVPMYKNAGDVQAPSPAPSGPEGKHHKRRTSGPPGSYGLHGHGFVPQDKLQKAYYEKHPELLKKEHTPHHYDRAQDFSMSSEDLNKIVRETVSRGSGLAVKNYPGTPSDQVAWQALEESTSRVASPGPAHGDAQPSSGASDSGKEARRPSSISDVIHVEEPNRRRSVMFSETESSAHEEDRAYEAPILAEDEVAKDPSPYVHQPAVELPAEKIEEPVSRPNSRPSSRPASLYKEHSFDMRSTPLEDVEEYEPLFDDDDKPIKKEPVKEEKVKKPTKKQRFPSADIWEDAPSSVYYTAEVSTPDINEAEKSEKSIIPPTGDGETPAQAFARHQEELAEKEAKERGPDGFVPRNNTPKKPSWAQHQPHLVGETKATRPALNNRFPSRDIWEDTPESLQLETTVSNPQQQDEASSPVAQAKPEIPTRPKPRQASGDDKPAIPERPKPQIPARPAKVEPTSGGQEPAEAAAPPRQKPAVPARPVGSKIAALTAGFMNDLNRRLQLGPQAPKKEEPAPEDQPAEEKEKAPLVDARKGRARGPQRRAPTVAKAEPAAVEEKKPAVTFTFSSVQTTFEIDEEGLLRSGSSQKQADVEPPVEPEAEAEAKAEAKAEAEPEVHPQVVEEVNEASSVPVAKASETKEAAEPEKTEEKPEESKGEAKAEESESKPEQPEAEAEPPKEETESLVTNTAGETVLEEQVKKDEKEQVVEPTKVEEQGGAAA